MHLLEEQINRREGGIEPLRRQSATGLKPAPRTTEDHPGTHTSVSICNKS